LPAKPRADSVARMTEPESPEPLESPPCTAWHPMLVALLERFLPRGYKLISEFLLSRLPQRADIVVVRLVDAEPGPVEKIHSIFDYLGAHTLIEYKGPTDNLAGEDVITLLGYGYQYMRLAKIQEPSDVCLMVIADRLTQSFLDQARRCRIELAEVDHGIWHGQFGGFVMHGVETGKAAERGRTEHLLFTFSRAFLQHPAGGPELDQDEAPVYLWLYQQVEQFRQARGTMAVKDIETFEQSMMEMFNSLSARHPEFVGRIVANCPPEKRLEGLSPEERLAGLPPEKRVEGLSPEDRLRGLSPEELEQLKRLLH
jgi:hypothetical protein